MGHESVDVLVVKLRFIVMQTLVRLRTLGSTAHHLAYPLFLVKDGGVGGSAGVLGETDLVAAVRQYLNKLFK